MYTLRFFSTRVVRELGRLQPADRTRVEARLKLLEQEPRPPGVVALESGVYRVRVGRYRIVYYVNDTAQVIVVQAILLRNERTYREFQSMLD